jgi:hypothetical protein
MNEQKKKKKDLTEAIFSNDMVIDIEYLCASVSLFFDIVAICCCCFLFLFLFVVRGGESGLVELEIYRFKPSIQPDMAAASLIISHAGKLPIHSSFFYSFCSLLWYSCGFESRLNPFFYLFIINRCRQHLGIIET